MCNLIIKGCIHIDISDVTYTSNLVYRILFIMVKHLIIWLGKLLTEAIALLGLIFVIGVGRYIYQDNSLENHVEIAFAIWIGGTIFIVTFTFVLFLLIDIRDSLKIVANKPYNLNHNKQNTIDSADTEI